MELNYALARLEHHAVVIDGLAAAVAESQARWRPTAAAWSILEVINHLVDEEREDFRQRIDFTLHRQGEAWPPIDPPGWVTARRYNQRTLAESRGNFLAARAQSLTWLRALDAPDWSRSYTHPAAGLLSAADLLAAWVAHDLLHIRQLTELQHAYLAVAAPGQMIRYAGDW